MQKKIIALAVAALASGAALAQSNVTIYGVADMYVGSFKADGLPTATRINSGGLSGSRIGFKGTEDLGNGLKALFTLEYALNLDQNEGVGTAGNTYAANAGNIVTTNTFTSQARQQFVGLTGGFGTAVAGRLQTTGYDWAVKFDPLAGSAISALQTANTQRSAAGIVADTGGALTPNGAGFGTMLIGATSALGARADNAIAYISPNISGVTVAVNHAQVAEQSQFRGAPGLIPASVSGEKVTANMLSAAYDKGPLAVGFVYAQATGGTNNVLTGIQTKIADWALGGSYNFGVVKLSATYQTSKVSGDVLTALPATGGNRDKAWSLGATVPVSAAGNVVASYAKNNMASTAAADNAKVFSVAYTHGLSKRTTAYTGYTRTDSETANRDTSALVAGLRHAF